MTDQHPITPPPELVGQWRNLPEYVSQLRTMSMLTITTEKLQDIATRAARWGADQELEACCKWIPEQTPWDANKLRTARRPKPPSLKERALQALANADGADHPVVATVLTADQHSIIRAALETLDD